MFLAFTTLFIAGLALTHQNSFISTLVRKQTILSSLYEHNQQALALIYILQELRPNPKQMFIQPPWDISNQNANVLQLVV
jgi:hypothetical protein